MFNYQHFHRWNEGCGCPAAFISVNLILRRNFHDNPTIQQYYINLVERKKPLIKTENSSRVKTVSHVLVESRHHIFINHFFVSLFNVWVIIFFFFFVKEFQFYRSSFGLVRLQRALSIGTRCRTKVKNERRVWWRILIENYVFAWQFLWTQHNTTKEKKNWLKLTAFASIITKECDSY